MRRVVYSRHYDIGFFGLERMHPFDSRKYGRAWREIGSRLGHRRSEVRLRPMEPVTRDALLSVHTEDYLVQLRESAYLAGALELPPLRHLPATIIDACVLKPMRWATAGTVEAGRKALEAGCVVNLSGGYHHAKPSQGEGFCIYADIAIGIQTLRTESLLSEQQAVAYVDLDAHQGNGVCMTCMDDERVSIFDMYNSQIYPAHDVEARERIDCDLPLQSGCNDQTYLGKLREHLPSFLDAAARSGKVGLGIYNAGTDIYQDDPLGQLAVSAEGILTRDRFVIEEFRKRRIPVVMLLSGGYTRESYRLIANSVTDILTSQDP